MTNIKPSDQWAENVLKAMRQTLHGRQRVEKAPPEIVNELVGEYRGWLRHFLDLIEGEEMTLTDVIKDFASQYEQWASVSREDRSRMNYFNVGKLTAEQKRAADDFEYHYRAIASKRLLCFFQRMAGQGYEHSIIGEVPPTLKEDHVKNPPYNYVERWHLFMAYPHDDRLLLHSLWRDAEAEGEIAMEWPPVPEDYPMILAELEASETPQEFLKGIDRPDAMPLIDHLLSKLRNKHSDLMAGGAPVNTEIPFFVFHPLLKNYKPPRDEMQRTESLMKLVYHEQTRRQVGAQLWDQVAALLRKHCDKYPSTVRWDGVAEQAQIARMCAQWQSNLEEYRDRPEVVKKKVNLWIEERKQRYERAREESDELAVKDFTPKLQKGEGYSPAEQAEKDAQLEEFHYLVYRDFLESLDPSILPLPNSGTDDASTNSVTFESLFATPAQMEKAISIAEYMGIIDGNQRYLGGRTGKYRLLAYWYFLREKHIANWHPDQKALDVIAEKFGTTIGKNYWSDNTTDRKHPYAKSDAHIFYQKICEQFPD